MRPVEQAAFMFACGVVATGVYIGVMSKPVNGVLFIALNAILWGFILTVAHWTGGN